MKGAELVRSWPRRLNNFQFTLCGELEETNDLGAEIRVAGTDMVLSEFSENQSVANNIGLFLSLQNSTLRQRWAARHARKPN